MVLRVARKRTQRQGVCSRVVRNMCFALDHPVTSVTTIPGMMSRR